MLPETQLLFLMFTCDREHLSTFFYFLVFTLYMSFPPHFSVIYFTFVGLKLILPLSEIKIFLKLLKEKVPSLPRVFMSIFFLVNEI